MAATPNALATAQIPVGTSATKILDARPDRREAVLVNHGTTDVLIGGSNVTAANGVLLAGIKGASITLRTTAAIYGIVAVDTQTVSAAESYA
jgi:hypothetical protein